MTTRERVCASCIQCRIGLCVWVDGRMMDDAICLGVVSTLHHVLWYGVQNGAFGLVVFSEGVLNRDYVMLQENPDFRLALIFLGGTCCISSNV
jgi:hypothetical protein